MFPEKNSPFVPFNTILMEEKKESANLHEAILVKDVEFVERFLLAGEDPNAVDAEGFTPLHVVAQSESYWSSGVDGSRIPELLVRYKAKVNARTFAGDTPLHLAIRSKQSDETIQFFLQANADVNARNAEGYTPLQLYIMMYLFSSHRFFYENGLQMLIKGKADVNLLTPKNETLLHMIIGNEKSDSMIASLFQAGVNPNSLDAHGETPLHRLVKSSFLLDGSNVFFKNRVFSRIDLLLKAGALINFPNQSGDTALHVAVQSKVPLEVIEYLLQRKADPNIRNQKGEPPFYTVNKLSSSGLYCESVMELFLRYGAM